MNNTENIRNAAQVQRLAALQAFYTASTALEKAKNDLNQIDAYIAGLSHGQKSAEAKDKPVVGEA